MSQQVQTPLRDAAYFEPQLKVSPEAVGGIVTALPTRVQVPPATSGFLFSAVKRVSDVIFAVIGLTITVLLLPLVAAAIKLNSRGPVFYRQNRVGLDGRVFSLVKFRTMRTDAEADGRPRWSSLSDPRVTAVGRVLRRTYVDELPQWWNVLRGEMSAVGPRPERPELMGEIERHVAGFSLRTMAKPGITGLAQVNYKYAASMGDARIKLSYDLRYIEKSALGLDLGIIACTLFRVFTVKGT